MAGAPAGPDGTVSFVEGDRRVYASVPVEGADWFLVTSTARSEAFAVANTVAQTVATVVGLSLLGLLAAAAVIGHQTVPPLTRLRAKARRMEEGDLEVDLSIDRTDETGELYAGFASMRDALRGQIEEARTARQEAEAARQEAEAMTRHLETTADAYSGVMGAVADGDLTRRMDPDGESEAMAEIAREFNEMVAEIEATVDRVQAFAGEVAASSEEVQATSEEVARSTTIVEALEAIAEYAEETNTRVQEISDATTEQATSTNQVVGMVEDVSAIAQQTSRESENVAGAAEEQTTALTEVTGSASLLAEQATQLSGALEPFRTDAGASADASDTTAGEGGDGPEPAEADVETDD